MHLLPFPSRPSALQPFKSFYLSAGHHGGGVDVIAISIAVVFVILLSFSLFVSGLGRLERIPLAEGSPSEDDRYDFNETGSQRHVEGCGVIAVKTILVAL